MEEYKKTKENCKLRELVRMKDLGEKKGLWYETTRKISKE